MKSPRVLRTDAAFSGVNLLIVLALALCGLVAWQWIRETRLASDNAKLKASAQKDHETKEQQVKSIENLQGEITRLETERKSSGAVARSNELKVVELARKLDRSEAEARGQSNLVSYLKTAFERATNQLAIANSNTLKANEVIVSLRKAIDDRNEIAGKLNEMNKKYGELMTERNDIVGKFNAFMQEVETERKKETEKKK